MAAVPGAERTNGAPHDEGLIDNRYRLLEKIGSGGMATVFLAEDERLGRRVAIKRLGTGAPQDAAWRLAREAKLGAALNHPNIVSIYDALSDPDSESVLIVMEFVNGVDLARDLQNGVPDERRALEILGDLASALDHAHEHGIIHRDVKPSNVLLGANGRTKLTDLGIAKALEDTGVTRSGVILGSVPYMSPEQLCGKPAGPESDTYSLALIAYEVLSGERAHKGDNPLRVTREALHEPPPDLRQVRPEVPAPAARVLAQALDRDPMRRPGAACAFVRELKEGLSAGSATAARQPAAAAPIAPPPDEVQQTEPERALPSVAERARSERFELPVAIPPETGRRGGFRWPAALATLALAAVAVAAILLIAGGSAEDAGRNPRKPTSAQQVQSGSDGASKAVAGTETGSPSIAATSDQGPAAAVETFYTQAAAGNFDAAFAVTTPNLQAQVGGTEQFETLESVEFETLKANPAGDVTASVTFETVATHTDRVDHCRGSATVVRDGGSWLLDSLDTINCTST